MPLYEYACAGCGKFERRAGAGSASAPLACPSCGRLAARSFTAPGGRGPRRDLLLGGLGAAPLARISRSEAGDPSLGALPAGRRIGVGGPPPLPPVVHEPGRPWQVGH